jgi:hypothetical protein
MKLGAENKKKTVAAIALTVVALLLVIRTLTGSGSTPAPVTVAPPSAAKAAQPAATGKRPARSRDSRHLAVVWTPTLDPRLRLDLLKDSEGLKYEGAGRNVFREHLEEIPKPVAPGLKTAQPVAAKAQPWRPAGPAPPPPINLKFFGWATEAGGPKAVLLSQDGNVFVAREGDIVARRYKVVRIGPNSVEIRDVLSNNTQTIPMSQG